MLKGDPSEPVFATVVYRTEISSRDFDFPAGTLCMDARIRINSRLRIKGHIKDRHNTLLLDTEALQENETYTYVEYFDSEDFAIKVSANQSEEGLRARAMELLVRKFENDVDNEVARKKKRLEMVADANSFYHNEFSDPAGSDLRSNQEGKHISWNDDLDMDIAGRERLSSLTSITYGDSEFAPESHHLTVSDEITASTTQYFHQSTPPLQEPPAQSDDSSFFVGSLSTGGTSAAPELPASDDDTM